MGNWMQRKWYSALNHKMDTGLRLQQSGVPLATLEHEWKAQIEAQLASSLHSKCDPLSMVLSTDFISGQSKNIADHTIADILEKQDGLKPKKENLLQAGNSLEGNE